MLIETTCTVFTDPEPISDLQPPIAWALVSTKPCADPSFAQLTFSKVSAGTSKRNEKRRLHLRWHLAECRLIHCREYYVAQSCTSVSFVEQLEAALKRIFPANPPAPTDIEDLI